MIFDKLSQDPLPLILESRPVKHLWDHLIPNERNNFHPHALGHRSLALFSILLLTVKIVTLASLTVGPVVPAFSSAITIENVVALTNNSRQASNLSGLTYNQQLEAAANRKASDMMAKQYFSHVSPDNRQPWDWISEQGYSYQAAGENLAVGFFQSESLSDAWMNSPGHRANILNSAFKEIGIGIANGNFQGQDTTVVVQMFGTQIQKAAPKPAPKPSAPKPVAKKTVAKAKPTQVAKSKARTSRVAAAKKKVAVGKNGKYLGASIDKPIDYSQLEITGVDVNLNGTNLQVTVSTNDLGGKVIASYQTGAIVLQPKDDNIWVGQIPLPQMANGSQLVITTTAVDGTTRSESVADFAPNFHLNYNSTGHNEPQYISVFGLTFSPTKAAKTFYIIFALLLAGLLTIAIMVRIKVQKPDLILGTAFVIVLSYVLWYFT